MLVLYVYAGPRTGKRGRLKTKDGKIDMKNLDLSLEWRRWR